MSDEHVPSPNNLKLLDEETVAELRALARSMRADITIMGDVIAEEVLFKERLLATTVTKLLQHASDESITLEEAVKVLTVTSKLHGEWQAAVAPIARKIGEDIRRMKKAQMEGGEKRGASLQPGPAGRLGDGGGRGTGRGRKGEAGPRADGQEARVPGPLVEVAVVVPDGD